MKRCNTCTLEKNLSEFYRDYLKANEYRPMCKSCTKVARREYKKQYHIDNKEKIQEYQEKNKEKLDKYRKQYKLKNKEKIKIYDVVNKEKIKKYKDNYYKDNYYKENKGKIRQHSIKNRDKRKIYNKQYRINNRDKLRENANIKYNTDPIYKLRKVLRGRIKKIVKNGFKAGSTIGDLGCSVPFLKSYLESKFYPHPKTKKMMTWNDWGRNYNKFQIDHITELHTVDLANRKDFLEVAHYTNLQPLWYVDHISKGRKAYE